MSITAHNRGDVSAPLCFIPQLWFRNTWSWGYDHGPLNDVEGVPDIALQNNENGEPHFLSRHPVLGEYHLYWQGRPTPMATNNETNYAKLYGTSNKVKHVKDAFHEYVVHAAEDAINPSLSGTKVGLLYKTRLQAGESRTFQLRLTKQPKKTPFKGFKPTMNKRRREMETFYPYRVAPSS